MSKPNYLKKAYNEVEMSLDFLAESHIANSECGQVRDNRCKHDRAWEHAKDIVYAMITYEDYVMKFFETHDDESYPVCFDEFFDNDWKVLNE